MRHLYYFQYHTQVLFIFNIFLTGNSMLHKFDEQVRGIRISLANDRKS